jgi:hypothetical protein
MSPMQQPAQLAALHPGAAWHEPAAHVSPELHALHAWPAWPQAAGVVEITQLLPWQQPAQFWGPQAGGVWHVRSFGCPGATQVCPFAEQFEHVAPFLPHAVESLPTTHVPFGRQQPEQLSGPQAVVPAHVPPTPELLTSQLWPAPHGWHC